MGSSNFSCVDYTTKRVLKSYDLNLVSRAQAIKECTALQTELRGSIDGGQSAKRADGKPAQIGGEWKNIDKTVRQIYKSSPESRQKIKYEVMPDKHAHDLILDTYVQRMDYIFQRASELDSDDKNRVLENLFRDLTATVRALAGDVYDLQERVGELMIRVDSLENWDKVAITPPGGFEDLPGYILPHFEPAPDHPPYPHQHGLHLIKSREEDMKFHQGKATLWEPSYKEGESPGIRRYLSAMKEAGSSLPKHSPRAEYEEKTRYNQGKVRGNGLPKKKLNLEE